MTCSFWPALVVQCLPDVLGDWREVDAALQELPLGSAAYRAPFHGWTHAGGVGHDRERDRIDGTDRIRHGIGALTQRETIISFASETITKTVHGSLQTTSRAGVGPYFLTM